MQKNTLILSASALILVLSAFKVISAEDTQAANEAKSVAWYVANIKEARAKNQECHDSPNTSATAECENALHALEISFKGGN